MRRRKQSNSGMVIFTILAAVVIFAVIGIKNGEDKRNYTYSETTVYYVSSGDTLWTIAQEYSDNRHDVRQVVYTIEKLSNCTANIHPGDKLIIPLYDVLQK